MKQVFFRTGYNYDMSAASDETGLSCQDESLAIQSAKEECDINTIVRRFGLTGQLPDQLAMPKSGDFSGVGDFHSAMNLVRQAQDEFLRVPGEIRARFDHDPARFMQFFEDPNNYDEALKMGLVNPRAPLPDPDVKA